MLASRLIAALCMAVLISSPVRSLADYEGRASFAFDASIVAHDLPADDFREFRPTPQTTVVNSSRSPARVSRSFAGGVDGAYGGFAQLAGRVQAEGGVGLLRALIDVELLAETNFLLGVADTQVAFAGLNSARATASWTDTTTVTDIALPRGAPIVVKGGINVRGFTYSSAEVENGGGQAFALANSTIKDNAGTVLAFGESSFRVPAAGDHHDDIPNGRKEVTLLYANGIPRSNGFSIEVTGRGHADRGYLFTGQPTIGSSMAHINPDWYQTLTWDGISGVFDAATGEPLNNWTIVSDSGFDYSKPYQVPEPSSVLLFSFGLCALLELARRRRCSGVWSVS